MTSELPLQDPLLETSERKSKKSSVSSVSSAVRKRFSSVSSVSSAVRRRFSSFEFFGQEHNQEPQHDVGDVPRLESSQGKLRRSSSQKWVVKDALVSNTKKLEYCMVNLKAKENGFPHNGLVWIPVNIDPKDDSKGTKWRPARLKRQTYFCGGRWAVRLPAGCNRDLDVELDTSTGYKSEHDNLGVPDNLGEPELRKWIMQKTYDNAKEILREATTEQVGHIETDSGHQRERLKKALIKIADSFAKHAEDCFPGDQSAPFRQVQFIQAFGQFDEDGNKELTCEEIEGVIMKRTARGTFTGQEIKEIFDEMNADKGKTVNSQEFVKWCYDRPKDDRVAKLLKIAEPEDESLGLCKSTAISEMSLGLGKSADKTYESPPYEDAYLLLHGISYFVFLVLSFCVMLATSSYILMQFFFLFLYKRTEKRLVNEWNFQFFVYFFAIPWMLVIASLFAFEVSGMIRSSMATPQMSRPCAFLVGLHMNFNQIKHKAGDTMNFKFKLQAGDTVFWRDLKSAMSYVDSWFTIGVECCMCFGEVGTVIHAVLNREEDFLTHTDPWTFYGTNFGLALVITVLVLWGFLWISDHNSEKQTGDRCLDRILHFTLPGRMLHWGRFHVFTVLGMLFISVFLALCNKEVAYEGVILGGWTWAVLTMFLYILSDMTLSPHQRIVLNQLDTCLQDRSVKPGHMGVRFYDIRAKLTQQLEMLNIEKVFSGGGRPEQEYDTEYVTLRYFVAANVVWGITYPLSLLIADPAYFSVIIVVGCSVMLSIVTQSILPALTILLGSGAGYLHFQGQKSGQHNDDLEQILTAAGPALFLIPVMICWHIVLFRRIPSIRRGSVKESIHPALFHFNVYHGFMFFYSLGSVAFFLMSALSLPSPMTSQDITKMGMFVNPAAQPPSNVGKRLVYPVCKMKWGSQGLDLGIVDMAILAKYAYAQNKSDFKDGINLSFNGTAAEVVWFDPFAEIPRMTATKFTSRKGEDTTIVLAIKGTSTPSEGFADASLYSGVAILGFLSQFVDIFDLVPNTLIAWALNHVRLPLVTALENNIIIRAANITMDLKNKNPDAHIVITGHSLGGGLAGAVGSITGVEAVTFSAPGAHFNRFVFDTTFEREWRNWVNIWPEVDVVPQVDRHDDMVQRIVCKNPQTGEQLDKATCHLATTTICELWRVCGDPRNRSMTLCTDTDLKYVDHSYGERTWGEYIRPERGHVKPSLPVGLRDLSDFHRMPTIFNDPSSGRIIMLFAAMVVPVSYSLMCKRPWGTKQQPPVLRTQSMPDMKGAPAAQEAVARSLSAPDRWLGLF